MAPGIGCPIESASSSKLPLSLGGQLLVLPVGERLGVAEGDVDGRVLLDPGHRAARPLWLPPPGSLHVLPPVRDLAQLDLTRGLHEDKRAGVEHLRKCPRIVCWIRRQLGGGDVTGGFHEVTEALVGDRNSVHPESVNRDPVHWTLFGIGLLGSHAERAPGNPYHVGKGRRSWWCRDRC